MIQLLTLIANVKPNASGPFWDGVAVAGDHYDIIGGSICGSFIVFGLLAVVCYRPWRRRVDRRRLAWAVDTNDELDDVDGEDPAEPAHGLLVDTRSEDVKAPSGQADAKGAVAESARELVGESSRG